MVLISPEFVWEIAKATGYPLKITFKRDGEGKEAGSMKALWNGDW